MIETSILASIGRVFAPIFSPLGFGNWASSVASITGLVAKEVVVATFAIVGSATTITFTSVTAYAFMIFTLLAAPCFAAIGAIRREMGSWKWTLIAVGYQTGLAYILALLINLIGGLIFPGASSVVLNPDLLEEAGESGITSIQLLENPLVYIFGIILVSVAVMALVRLFRNNKQRTLADRDINV